MREDRERERGKKWSQKKGIEREREMREGEAITEMRGMYKEEGDEREGSCRDEREGGKKKNVVGGSKKNLNVFSLSQKRFG